MAREERRREILEAAGRVFYQQGYDRAKMEDIAKEAGLGKGTLYEYFVSKKHLFEEMVNYHQKRYLAGVVEAIRSGSNFREKFIALAKYQAELVQEHMSIFEKMAYSRLLIVKWAPCL
jgi:AcrR family transcriptional regulator